MKKLFTLLLAVVYAVSLRAYSFSQDYNGKTIYYSITSNTAPYTVAVTYVDRWVLSYSGNVTIPASVTYDGKTYAVTRIGYEAFYYCSGLTSITIPNSVTSIEGYAFAGVAAV